MASKQVGSFYWINEEEKKRTRQQWRNRLVAAMKVELTWCGGFWMNNDLTKIWERNWPVERDESSKIASIWGFAINIWRNSSLLCGR